MKCIKCTMESKWHQPVALMALPQNVTVFCESCGIFFQITLDLRESAQNSSGAHKSASAGRSHPKRKV